MRNALSLVLGVVTLSMLAACGDASDSAGNQRAPAFPNDPSEQPGAPQDPDSPANPNSSTLPAAPTAENTSSTDTALSVDNATPATDLGTTTVITVTVTPVGTASSTATLTVSGLPDGVTGTFDPASVQVGGAPVTSKLTLMVPYTTLPSAKGAASALIVKATTPGGSSTANANFKVNPQVTLNIPMNYAALEAANVTGNVDGWGGPTFGAAAVPLQTQAGNGITFLVKNTDSKGHIVHGQAGFPHGDQLNPVPAGALDPKSRVLDPAAGNINSSGYLHAEAGGTAVGFAVKVNLAP